MELVRNNFGLKLLALALALVGWAYVRYAGNPIFSTGSYDQQLSVPIATANLTTGYVARFTDREAVVTITTKRNDPAIKPDEIKAVLDLVGKGAGIYNLPVQLVAPDLVVSSLSPASVTLTIERIEVRTFPIVVHYTGSPAPGTVVSSVQIRPAIATVRASTSVLAQVAAVRVDVALPDAPKSIDEMLRPVAADASGAEVSNLTVAPDLVRVRARFVTATPK